MKLKKRVNPVKVTNGLVNAVEEFLGIDGIDFFKEIREKYGKVDAIWNEYFKSVNIVVPHIVHFMEGMMVRNFMRESGLCKGWTCIDFDDNWITVVNAVLDKYIDSNQKIEQDDCYD